MATKRRRTPRKIENGVEFFYRCPHCRNTSFSWVPEDTKTMACGAWRCRKRFYKAEGYITEDDWGRAQYGRADWRKLHNEYLKKANAYLAEWFRKDNEKRRALEGK